MLLTLLHPTDFVLPGELWRTWTLTAWSIVPVVVPGLLYATGLHRLWHAAGAGHGIRRHEAGCFAAGVLLLFVALVSPLDALGGALFSAHMLQHVVLMLAAAPLMVLGRPFIAFSWALPERWRRPAARRLTAPPARATWRALAHPLSAWLLHAAALWVWHVPVLYEATLHSEWIHAAQHASFFGTAMLFWWSVIEHAGRTRAGHGVSVLSIFTTAVHSSVLGALLTFSLTVWYPIYAERAALWGLTPLQDQQLGGLVMWVPAGLIYVVAALAALAALMAGSDRAVRRAPLAEATR
jgi:putative membrane protein